MFRHLATLFVLMSLVGLSGCDDVPDLSLPNEPPLAVDDLFLISQNQSIVALVAANDFDIDGDELVITATTDPANGVIENLGGSILYTPDLYFVGSDEFTYEITDTVGHVSSATVSIEIARRETRAIFSTTSGTEQTLHMLDSRDAGTLVDLGQSLDTGEILLNWAISESLELAVLLTDADRVLFVPLGNPATPSNIISIDTTSGPVDGGLLISNDGSKAVYTLDNRYVVYFNLEGDFESIEIDTAFDSGSTMGPSFFAPLDPPIIFDTAIIMEGTLGTDAEERSAIYAVSLSGAAPIAILDDAAILQSTLTRPLFGLNAMAWLTDSAVMPPIPAAYSCSSPPPQTLGAMSYTLLGNPGPGTDLNATSGLLTDPTNLISYNYAHSSRSVLVAACPLDTDIVQIIEIPFTSPASAQVVATADDTSDGLWNIDIDVGGQNAIYVLDGDTGLRTLALDLADTDPVVSDLTASAPDFQTYNAGTELRLPPSVLSTDGLRWLFLAPVGDALTKLEWLDLATSEINTLELPFAATNLVSDGFFAVVQGETGGTGSAPIALIYLQDPQVTSVDVAGTLAESLTDPLNQIESAIRLYPVQ